MFPKNILCFVAALSHSRKVLRIPIFPYIRNFSGGKDGFHWVLFEEVYIQRYLISWGIHFLAEDGDVSLYLLFELQKGINDEFLDWPFSNTLKLCLIHPETQQEHCASDQGSMEVEDIKFFGRPLKDSNEFVYLPGAKFQSSYCERNGFIKEDNLLLKLEVLT